MYAKVLFLSLPFVDKGIDTYLAL